MTFHRGMYTTYNYNYNKPHDYIHNYSKTQDYNSVLQDINALARSVF